MLSFEYQPDGIVEIFMDDAGKEQLLAVLSRMRQNGDHEDLMTVSWGAGELEQTTHKPENTVVNMVTIGKVSS